MATEGFEQAVSVAKGVLTNVEPDQLDDPTPCASWKVRDVINHLVGGSYFFAAATNGEAAGDGADAPDFASGDYRAAYRGRVEAGHCGVRCTRGAGPYRQGVLRGVSGDRVDGPGNDRHVRPRVGPREGDRAEHRPRTPARRPAAFGARQAISEALRGDEPMPFAAEKSCPDGASAADRLAAFLGRTV